MIIVSGSLSVDPAERDGYVRGCVAVVAAARATPGCLEFHISADPIEPDRVNVYERWASVDDVEAFRGSGPSESQQATIRSAAVRQYEIASSIDL